LLADNLTVVTAARIGSWLIYFVKPIGAWVVALFVGGGFFLAAQRSNLFEARNALMLYGLVVATFLVCYFISLAWTDRPWRWALPTIIGTLLGDGLAIPRDLAKDPTSHNMWPMELLLLATVVSVCALAGAFTGAHLSKRMARLQSSSSQVDPVADLS
jgi:hypothetical protein